MLPATGLRMGDHEQRIEPGGRTAEGRRGATDAGASGGWLKRWIDPLVPPPIREQGGDGLRRGRLVVVAALLGVAAMLPSALWSLTAGLSPTLVRSNIVYPLLIVSVLVLARRVRSVSLLANLLVAVGFSQVALFCLASSGQHYGALFSIASVPLVAMLLAGWRSGMVFAGLSALVVLGSGHVPEGALSGLIVWRPEDPTAGVVRDAFFMVVGIGLFAGLYDWSRQAALDETRDALDRAEASERHALRVSGQQAMMAEIARKLQMSEPGDFDDLVVDSLRLAAGLVGGERAVLTLFEPSWERMLARHSWQSRKLASGDFDWSDLKRGFRSFPWMTKVLQRESTVVLRSLDDLPPEASVEREVMSERGATAWVSMRVRAGRWAHGFLSVECHGGEHDWTEQELSSLRLVGELLAGNVARARAEHALRESEERFSRAFAAHPDGLALTRLDDDVIIECNESFRRGAGFASREQAIGESIMSMGSALAPGQLEAVRDQLREAGRADEIEVEVPDGPHRLRTLLISARQIEIDGTPCALTIFRDVTSHRQLELELRQAQKMEAVGRLAGGIAHDFNNMLTVIAGYSEVLHDSVDEELKPDVECISDAARRSAALTRQLLAFSRRQVLEPEVLDLGHVLTEQESMLRPLIGENVAVHYELDPDAASVKVDPGQMQQVIMNLVINARDAMPDGGNLTFSVGTAEVSDSAEAVRLGVRTGRYVRLAVRDDGRGMSRETADRVLEPFFTTKPEGEGTGLGLATVHGIVRQSGGGLAIRSELHKGTTVEIYLPESKGDLADETGETGGAATGAGKGTILVVEDELTVRRLSRRALEDAGYRVIEANDGVHALEVMSRHESPVDLLLTDVVMPRMGGVELAEQMQRMQPGLRVAFMSGYPARGEESQRPLPRGVPLIAKPFRPTDLCAQVAELLAEGIA